MCVWLVALADLTSCASLKSGPPNDQAQSPANGKADVDAKGTFLYGSLEDPISKIAMYDLGLGALKELATVDLQNTLPGWSADGEKVALVEGIKEQAEIVEMNFIGSTKTSITSDEFEDQGPAYGPDGRTLIFLSKRTGQPELFKYDNRSKKLSRLTNNDLEDASKPIYSPDGSKIALLIRKYKPFRHLELAIFNRDGSTASVGIPGLERQEDLDWSPDSKKIALSGYYDGSWQVCIWDLETGDLQKYPAKGENVRPTWAPDGKAITFTSIDKELWDIALLDVRTGKMTNLTPDMEAMAAGSWFTRDGEHIVFSAFSEETIWDIWLMNKDGTGKRMLINTPAQEVFYGWRPGS